MSGYDQIKRLAADHGRTIPSLLALARQNDPFFCGAPAQLAQAHWFADLWGQFRFVCGVHLRRVHYRLVSQETPVKRHDGKPYENTQNSWSYLCCAAKQARYLGLVSVTAFEDHRNPDPILYSPYPPFEATPEWYMEDDFPKWTLPRILVNLTPYLSFALAPSVRGYGYDLARDQPYLLEVWVEKSTMNDVLLPVCRDYGANLVTSLGFQSITSVIDLLKRIHKADKPARIFYISDFDPGGDGMPVGVSRQIEYWREEFAPGADIRLLPLALTKEQVIEYRLPSIPIKDSDKRKESFQTRYGMEATELDALEALHPGRLRNMVSEALKDYHDSEIFNRLCEASDEAEEIVTEAWQEVCDPFVEQVDAIKTEADEIYSRYRERLAALASELNQEIDPLQERLDAVRQDIQQAIDDFDPDLPDRPEPDIEPEADADEWLFDSTRDYMDQLAVYAARKRGDSVEDEEV